MTDEFEELDDFAPADDGEADAGSGDAPPSSGASEDRQSKRINDLMSKWQTEAAARKRAEEALAQVQRSGGQTPPPAAAGVAPEVEAWLTQAREAAIDRVYDTDSRFGEYGVERSALAGVTPGDIAANASRYRVLFEKLESGVRNRVLREHGFAPELGGERRPANRDYASMSKDDFEAEIQRAKRGI